MNSIPELTQAAFDFDSPPLCACGCGGVAPIAKRTRKELGVKKGEYVRFLPYHANGIGMPLERFWNKVSKGAGPDDCWLWTGSISRGGYGVSYIGTRYINAHRHSYEIHFGPIPQGLLVCHRCDVRNCVRPDHLFLGTQSDNQKDSKSKHRTQAGEKHWSHKHPESLRRGVTSHHARLTEDSVRELRHLRAQGLTYQELGERFGIRPSSAWKIATYKSWAHIR